MMESHRRPHLPWIANSVFYVLVNACILMFHDLDFLLAKTKLPTNSLAIMAEQDRCCHRPLLVVPFLAARAQAGDPLYVPSDSKLDYRKKLEEEEAVNHIETAEGFVPGLLWDLTERARLVKAMSDERRKEDLAVGLTAKEQRSIEEYATWLHEVSPLAFGNKGAAGLKIAKVSFGHFKTPPVSPTPPAPPPSPPPSSSPSPHPLDRPQLGLFAKQNYLKGDVIAQVPRRWWFATRLGQGGLNRPLVPEQEDKKDDKEKGKKEEEEVDGEVVEMAALLLQEQAKGQDSKWAPFIQMLPRSFEDMPMFWPQDSLDLIAMDPLVDEVKAESEQLRRAFRRVNPNLTANATLDEFLWAVAAVKSRSILLAPTAMAPEDSPEAFAAEGEPQKGGDAAGPSRVLIPGMDLFNFHHRPNAGWNETISRDQTWFTLTAEMNIVAGQEITVPFPVADTSFLLLNFGFVPFHNPFDKVVMFADVADLATFYADAVVDDESQPPLDVEAAIAKANEAMEKVNYLGEEFDYGERQVHLSELNDDGVLSLRANGLWDPRLLVAATVIIHHHKQTMAKDETPLNVNLLATSALEFVFQRPKTDCDAMALRNADRSLHSSLLEAISLLWQVAGGMIEEFGGGPFEDEHLKLRLQHLNSASCKTTGTSRIRKTCEWAPTSKELATRYRMSVKLLLENGIDFLGSSCPSMVEQEGTGEA